jgi:hypothetical protein
MVSIIILYGHQRAMNAQTTKYLTSHFRNYESISGFPTRRTEIQTAESTSYIHVCLTVVSFPSTAYKPKHTRKTNQAKQLTQSIKRLHVNCTLKLQTVIWTTVRFVVSITVRYKIMPTERSIEFYFQNLLFYFFIPNNQKAGIYRQI